MTGETSQSGIWDITPWQIDFKVIVRLHSSAQKYNLIIEIRIGSNTKTLYTKFDFGAKEHCHYYHTEEECTKR